MPTFKKCQKCLRVMDVMEFQLQATSNGRSRRKNTCTPCLANSKEMRRRPVVDARDTKPDIEEAINEMVRAGRLATHGDEEVCGA